MQEYVKKFSSAGYTVSMCEDDESDDAESDPFADVDDDSGD